MAGEFYLENYKPSWRDRLADLMGGAANAISGKPYSEARNDSMTLLGAFPVTGTAMAAEDMGRDLRHGDLVGAGVNALGVIPDLGAGLKMMARGLPGALEREALAPLRNAPAHVEGPVPAVQAAADEYAKRAGLDLQRQPSYAEVSPRRGRYIAEAYDRMPHDPADPRVAASYGALADETMKQWQAMLDSGAKIDFLKPGTPDPYPGGPRDALTDLRANNHLSVFPTEQGFGSINASAADNPMLAPTGINHGGHDMLVNDAFRAVHDYFGHGMEGANFGARGEENAWQAHKRLFSPDAIPALTTETRGQNSWVNFGPHGDANRANPRETTYADQKAGMLPSWATKENGMPMSYRAQQVATLAALASALGLAGSAEQDK